MPSDTRPFIPMTSDHGMKLNHCVNSMSTEHGAGDRN